jgi:hypothetical protein
MSRWSGELGCNEANVFEKAIYLHCNLAYLQYFEDGNKRTARMMQTAAMVKGGILPLFFNDTLADRYTRAVVVYYETGDYAPYVSFFKENHRLAIASFLGREPSVGPDPKYVQLETPGDSPEDVNDPDFRYRLNF